MGTLRTVIPPRNLAFLAFFCTHIENLTPVSFPSSACLAILKTQSSGYDYSDRRRKGHGQRNARGLGDSAICGPATSTIDTLS